MKLFLVKFSVPGPFWLKVKSPVWLKVTSLGTLILSEPFRVTIVDEYFIYQANGEN